MRTAMRMLMVLGLNAVGLAADGDAPGQIPPPGAMANAMKDPAMLDQAMKMMQNPLVMQQMKVMMQDPAVKARMRRMLQRCATGPTARQSPDCLPFACFLSRAYVEPGKCSPQARRGLTHRGRRRSGKR